MASCDLPYFCPRCGDDKRFDSVPALRSHLVSRHTYETLLVLSQARARSSSPGTLLPLLPHAMAQPEHPVLDSQRERLPFPLACLDLASSSASTQLLIEMLTRRDQGGGSSGPGCSAGTVATSSSTAPPHSTTALVLPGCRGDSLPDLGLRGLGRRWLGPSLGLEFGLCLDESLTLGLGLDERLGVERSIARTFSEVEERVSQHVGCLRAELERREAELEHERRDAARLEREKEELEDQASHLSRQVAVSVEMMATLRRDLQGKEQELCRKQQEVCDIERFLTATADREAEAKLQLQIFIEALLERADRAERKLQLLVATDRHTHNDDRHTHNDDRHTHNHDRHTHNDDRHTHNDDRHTHNHDRHTHNDDRHTRNDDRHTHNHDRHTHNDDRHTHNDDRHTHNDDRHTRNNDRHTHNDDRHTHNDDRHTHSDNSRTYNSDSPSHNGTNGHRTNGHIHSGSEDDIITGSKLIGYRRSYSVSGSYRLGDQIYHSNYGAPAGRMRTLSLGSGGWDSDSVGGWATPLEAHYYHVPCSTREGGERREKGYRRTPEGRGGWGRTRWRAPPSTEEEEEEDDEEEDTWSEAWSTPETQRHAHIRLEHSPGSGVSSIRSSPCQRGYIALGAGTLRLRAGLFCVFPYLDVRTLLLAAEVCSDWRFVARHPAVWTRVRLENARVSTKFLVTMSQWCTQTHSLVLQNLKPRLRHRDERREDYDKTTRGCLEGGVEALLRSAGGSLMVLRVSHCPHVLTDRSLWLASCYCRNLQHLTYRSSSDPMGHEVVWALGAGCRNMTSLQVAPLHPCQQPTRFSNRCLQTIGRCWPHLRVLSVGGAGCSIQGLSLLVRSCVGLQVLELERVTELGQEGAAELCIEGLQNLETLLLTSTPVTPEALLHFNSACCNLRSIIVQIGIADHFEEPDSPEAKRQYNEMVNTLQALKKRPGLSEVLQIKADVFV
ncbi:F-box only protein 41-like isoform X1 [Salvelinus alpinus]|uniref:F-box only protein 41-like isoform X1 n=2 Tax=Salvelinus alpinus TaxID=8036 RepID=UPI0039FBA87F